MIRPNALKAALHERMRIEAVRETVSDVQVRLVLRVPSGNSTQLWLGVIKGFYLYFQGKSAVLEGSVDISKFYFLDPPDTTECDLKYGWRVILQGPKIDTYYEDLIQVVRGVRVPVTQIEEVVLQGSPRRARMVRETSATFTSSPSRR